MTTLQALAEQGADRWIRAGREARGWSQVRLVRLLWEQGVDIDPRTLQNYERGSTKKIPYETLAAIDVLFDMHRVKRPTTRQTLPRDQLRSTGALTPRSPLRLAWVRLAA